MRQAKSRQSGRGAAAAPWHTPASARATSRVAAANWYMFRHALLLPAGRNAERAQAEVEQAAGRRQAAAAAPTTAAAANLKSSLLCACHLRTLSRDPGLAKQARCGAQRSQKFLVSEAPSPARLLAAPAKPLCCCWNLDHVLLSLEGKQAWQQSKPGSPGAGAGAGTSCALSSRPTRLSDQVSITLPSRPGPQAVARPIGSSRSARTSIAAADPSKSDGHCGMPCHAWSRTPNMPVSSWRPYVPPNPASLACFEPGSTSAAWELHMFT